MWHAQETRSRNLTTGAAIAWVVALGLPASGVASEPQRTFSQRLEVIQIEIDLVVTDQAGHPVTELDPRDLALYHNGERQEVLFLEPPSSRLANANDSRQERPRHLIIYADNLRIWPKRRNALLRRLDGFIEHRIARGDRISIVAFDGSIELLAIASREAGDIRTALTDLASRPTSVAQIATEARQLRWALAEGLDFSTLQPRIERYVERLRLDAARSVAGLAKTIRVIATPAHSVSILYLSDGIPARPGDELADLERDDGPRIIAGVQRGGDDPTESGVPTPSVQYLASLPRSRSGFEQMPAISTTPLLEPLIRIANAHRVTFYPVRPSAFFHASLTGSRARASGGEDHIGPLRQLARSTGGDFVNRGQFEAALTRLSRRLDSTYSLGFQVQAHDELPHGLEIKLARRGLKPHYRRECAATPRVGRPVALPNSRTAEILPEASHPDGPATAQTAEPVSVVKDADEP